MFRFFNRPAALYFSIALSLVFIVWMGMLSSRFPAEGQVRMVPLEIASTSAAYHDILKGWLGDPPDGAGLAALRSSFRVDFGFIVGYVLLLVSSLANAAIDRLGPSKLLLRIPFLVGALDVVENAFHLMLLSSVKVASEIPVLFSQSLLFIASTASHGKWILFALVSFMLLILYIRNFKTINLGPKIAIGVVILALFVFDAVYISALTGF